MPKRRNRRDVICIENLALRRSEVFTVACAYSLPVLAIICEHAAASKFTDLVEIYKTTPEIVDNMCRTARITGQT